MEELPIAPPPPPKVPTKEEIKALKKRDHQLLNALKVAIQPIMDQIQRKYKKFRNPVIPQSAIQYLYDEQEPNFVRPDVVQFRPFELEKDKDGIVGLRETATGKFYYNLETTTIEERLANGYYCRAKDFLFDIKTLAKDARNFGERDRIIKANELLTNVEVDVAGIESSPAMADCENVYQRQLNRTKEKEEKARVRLEAEASPFPPLRSDHAQAGDPVALGMPPTHRLPHLGTPLNTTSSSLSNGNSAPTNGTHSHSNGDFVPSRKGGDDVHMGGTDDGQQDSPGFDSQAMPPPISQWRLNRGPSNLSGATGGAASQGYSQTSGFQQIPHDVSPTSIINYASTTTSGGKRTSSGNDTQLTNGQQNSPINDDYRDSQIPDTQREVFSTQGQSSGDKDLSSGDKEWPHSQAQGLAKGHILSTYSSQASSSGSQGLVEPPIAPIFPDGGPPDSASLPAKPPASMAAEPTSSQASSEKDLVLDENAFEDLFHQFVRKSSGCSIEQLEQINRELMNELWNLRGEWNRVSVANSLAIVFNDTIDDISNMQKILKPSQETQLSQDDDRDMEAHWRS